MTDLAPRLDNVGNKDVAATGYWVDWLGYLWHGPQDGPDGWRYMRLDGVKKDGTADWQWRAKKFSKSWEACSPELAERVIRQHLDDWRQRKNK